MFTSQQIKERDAALIVLHDEPPSDKWFRMWEDWFIKQAGPDKSESVRTIFRLARKGSADDQDIKKAAKQELSEMLESLARQVKVG